ncbi:MAG: glutamate 5-kinase [Spirochaetales bacterium]|jgi:glutamate 5-kinase|nr:glutamate 5-kinase [Spirochaetales bacterium]
MKLLVKIGSALISRANRIDREWLNAKVDEMAMLFREGNQICLVSSGAVAAGMEIQGLRHRPKGILDLQLLSGQGQVRLYRYYGDFFKERYIFSAQVLLTHHNFDNPQEVETLVNILNEYMNRGIIPIINENDLINKEELEDRTAFPDNDILAALVSRAVKADLALILTNVDGLYPRDPGEGGDEKVIPVVERITPEIKSMASRGKSALGMGGMLSKIEAAEMITAAGIPLIVANGRYTLQDILENKTPRTLFNPQEPSH